MQSADAQNPPKRSRRDGSPKTPPKSPPADAETSPSHDLHPDHRTWGPKQVCSFLRLCGFSDSELLKRCRGIKAGLLRGRGAGDPCPGQPGLRGRPEAVSGGPLRGAREAEGDRTREAPEGVDLRRWRRGGNDLRRRAPGEGDRREGRGRLDKGGTRKDGPVAAAPRRDDLRWRGRRNGASGVGDP